MEVVDEAYVDHLCRSLEGYVIPPSAYDNLPDDFGTQGAGAARSASGRPLRLGHAVMLGFELDENVDVASLDGYCIDYSVGTSPTIYRRCLSQSLRIGDDLPGNEELPAGSAPLGRSLPAEWCHGGAVVENGLPRLPARMAG